jgi:hypothetical protein
MDGRSDPERCVASGVPVNPSTSRRVSIDDRFCGGLFDPVRGHVPTGISDALAIKIGVDHCDLAPVDPDPVCPLVHVRVAYAGRDSVDPLNRDPGIPGPAARGDVQNTKVRVREEAEEASEPAGDRLAGVALASKCMITGEHVMDVLSYIFQDTEPIAAVEVLEPSPNATPHD